LESGLYVPNKRRRDVLPLRIYGLTPFPTREPDGTVADVTNYVAYEAKVRWWLVLLLSAVFAAGIVCLCIASIRSARIQPSGLSQ